ncbi:MAG: Coq4 family protein [Myxococcota bacterium]
MTAPASTAAESDSAPQAETKPTWYWRLDFDLLRQAAAIRKKDPTDFRSAVLFFFGFGGRDDGEILRRMRSHPEGKKVLADRIPLPDAVLRPELLKNLPKDTLGYQYWAHCRENQLDPLLISTESQKVASTFPATDEHRFVYDRYRDSHDLWHVLTGYGTDMAGEAGIIGWTYAQLRNRGFFLIFLLNATMCTLRGRPDVFRTAFRGVRHGKRSPLLLAVDWNRFLDRPIDAVRRELGLEVAAAYPVFHMADAPGAPPA